VVKGELAQFPRRISTNRSSFTTTPRTSPTLTHSLKGKKKDGLDIQCDDVQSAFSRFSQQNVKTEKKT
jgi:hypothetical protein